MLFQKKIEELYKAQFFTRYDDIGLVKYFTHEDFEGLSATPYTFVSSHGHTLRGAFYFYENFDPTKLIIFEHGLGGGHLSYMKEIERLCRAGYRVFSYDHTGCMTSGGKNCGGFAQSLCDLDDCLKALKADPDIPTDTIYITGHSWGGFSTLNIAAFHPDIKKIVVLAGFVSVKRMLAQFFPAILAGYRKAILRLEAENNPQYVNCDAVETLQNANVDALLIYSDNDPLIKKKVHYDPLCKGLANKPSVQFMLECGKGHNPNYATEALPHLAAMANGMKEAVKLTKDEEKTAFKDAFDWDIMTKQDENVWRSIIAFLGQ